MTRPPLVEMAEKNALRQTLKNCPPVTKPGWRGRLNVSSLGPGTARVIKFTRGVSGIKILARDDVSFASYPHSGMGCAGA
jgi:hypothetical protein